MNESTTPECPNCHRGGEYASDNKFTSLFVCPNQNCRVSSFDHIPVAEAKKIHDDE